MKRLILKILCLVLPTILVCNIIMLLPKDRSSKRAHEANVALSYERLKSLKDSDKIVIIAGSNGQFGINSQMLSEEFSLPVVNTSAHVGLGVRLQFEIYKEFLKRGDIVIFCLEYNFDEKRLYGDVSALRILSTHLPAAYLKLPPAQWLHLYKYIGVGFKEKFITKHAEGTPYGREMLNKYGDIACERKHQDSIPDIPYIGEYSDVGLEYYSYMSRYAKEHGLRVVFLPPSLMKREFNKYRLQIDTISSMMAGIGLPYQASPERYALPDSLFYDTPYHLTKEGTEIRTRMMIEDIRKALSHK